MLNTELYSRLLTVFKKVTILNEDQQHKIKKLKFPKSFGGIVREWEFEEGDSGETFQVDCPICGDTKGHCRISSLSFTRPRIGDQLLSPAPLLIHCFRRGCFKGNPEAKEELSNALFSGEPISLDVLNEDNYFGQALSLHDDIHKNTENNLLKWQPDYHPITEDAPSEVLDYVSERGLNWEDIVELKIGWGKCWNHKKSAFIGDRNWLMFPIIDQAGIRGFQSRQLRSDCDMKYFFDSRTPKKMVLYNRERASRYPIVAIAEGIIDALHIGKFGMAFFGFEPSSAQIKLLQQDGAKMVLYIPDQKLHFTKEGKCDLNPPEIASRHIQEWNAKKLFEWGAYRIDLCRADAGECTTTEIHSIILDQLCNRYNLDDFKLDTLERQLL